MYKYPFQKITIFIFLFANNLAFDRKNYSTHTEEAVAMALAQLDLEPEVLKKHDDVSDLLNVILEAISHPRHMHPRLAVEGGGNNLEAFVLALSQEKRKALSDLLGIVLNSWKSGMSSEPLAPGKTGHDEEVQLYTLPPWQNIQEFLNYLSNADLYSNSTKNSAPFLTEISESPLSAEDLKKLIFETIENQKAVSKMHTKIPDEAYKKSVDRFVLGLLNGGMRIHNFA